MTEPEVLQILGVSVSDLIDAYCTVLDEQGLTSDQVELIIKTRDV